MKMTVAASSRAVRSNELSGAAPERITNLPNRKKEEKAAAATLPRLPVSESRTMEPAITAGGRMRWSRTGCCRSWRSDSARMSSMRETAIYSRMVWPEFLPSTKVGYRVSLN